MHTLANIALVNRDGSDFSDLNTDLDAQQLAPTADEQAKAFYGVAKPQEAVICPKCKGSGRFRSSGGFRSAGRDVGPCFPCGGSGSVSEEKAASMRTYQKGQATKAANFAAKLTAFEAAHKDCIEYCGRVQNDFTQNCLRKLATDGEMSVNQVRAIRENIERSKARAEQARAAAPSVAGAGFERLLEGFKHAAATGLKKPTLKCREIVFSLAAPTSKNAGHVYVKIGGNYKGKITPEGKFLQGRDDIGMSPSREEVAEIMRIGRDPLAAAVEHGRLTGRCSICSRKLVDPKSVAAGIGPICAENMGWSL